MIKFWFITAAVIGGLSVALGAFGAHALKDTLDVYGRSIYEKAVLYQMFHTFAIFAVGFLQYQFRHLSFSPAGWAFLAGVILFSGSLYLLAVTGIKTLGAITPIGGVSFIFGWGWLIFQMAKINE
ncbi:MAG: DUF423 domain-containing protein [Calditrichaceae bacterium]